MQIFDSLTSIIAPHICIGCGSEGSVLCDECIDQFIEPAEPRCIGCMKLSEGFRVCVSCRKRLPYERIIFCMSYDGIGEQLIKSLKYELKRQAADTIALIMAQNSSRFIPEQTVVCPIPTSPSRVRERGFDHTKLISKALTRQLQLKMKNMLWRSSKVHQVGATRAERLAQMKDVLKISTNDRGLPNSVLLIDDVYTTGATLITAGNVLKKAGVKHLSAIVFARKV